MTQTLLLAISVMLSTRAAASRPNIVWIVSEDNSVHFLAHFFPGGAAAANIESMAAHGITFDHAFANSPVCSVARTTLMTGCYAPQIGAQYHRPFRRAALRTDWKMFPAYLRDAGYYTTNNAKTDYNVPTSDDVWDESSSEASWRSRPDPSQPFFHMQTFTDSHESSMHFTRDSFRNRPTQTDPESVRLPPYLPDTPLMRYTGARYLDRMTMVDEKVGRVLEKLEADGVLEETFVFYFSDHGGVLPRSKGYVYDTGLHVPLVVRVPAKFSHLIAGDPNGRRSDPVSFVDFGPTVLHLAGVDIPSHLKGEAFLGPRAALRHRDADVVFAYADRFDEKSDFVRSVYRGRFHYIRNYLPYLPRGLCNRYRYTMLAFDEWRTLQRDGKLAPPQAEFFEPKPIEELYDLESDPYEVRNLAYDSDYKTMLVDLRQSLQDKVKSLPDLSFFPESYLVAGVLGDPVAFGRSHAERIATLVDTADLALFYFAEAKDALAGSLADEDPWVRYWALIVCTSFGERAKCLAPDAQMLTDDPSPWVRWRAYEFLGLLDVIDPQPHLAKLVSTTESTIFATEVLNSITWFNDHFAGKYPAQLHAIQPTMSHPYIMHRLQHLHVFNSATLRKP